MKKIILITTTIALLFTACENREDHSDAYGTFSADKIMVSSLANGRIVFADYEEGEKIGEGELVAIIDTTDLVLQIRQLYSSIKATTTKLSQIDAQAEVQKQQMKNLSVDIKRVKKLIPDGAATQKQLDDLNGAFQLTEKQLSATLSQKESVLAEISSMRVQIERTEEAVENCYVHNPTEGIVLTKMAYKGEVANFGKTLFTIANLKNIDLKVFVSGAQLPEIKIGQEVKVLVDDGVDGKRELSGEVVHIAENAEFTPKIIQTKEERVKLVYAVKVCVENDGSLKIGMPGEVNF